MGELELDSLPQNHHVGEEEKGRKSRESVISEANGSKDSNDIAAKYRKCNTSASLWTLLPAVVIACIMSLLGGTTLSYSSSTLLELKELPNSHFRFDNSLLSDLFGVSCTSKYLVLWHVCSLFITSSTKTNY